MPKQWVTTIWGPEGGNKAPSSQPELLQLIKYCRHLSPTPTTAASPPVLQHAVLLLLCMSDVPLLGPRGVSPHIFYREWVECATLFLPLPATKYQSSKNPKQMYHITDLTHDNTSLRNAICLDLSLWNSYNFYWFLFIIVYICMHRYASFPLLSTLWRLGGLSGKVLYKIKLLTYSLRKAFLCYLAWKVRALPIRLGSWICKVCIPVLCG